MFMTTQTPNIKMQNNPQSQPKHQDVNNQEKQQVYIVKQTLYNVMGDKYTWVREDYNKTQQRNKHREEKRKTPNLPGCLADKEEIHSGSSRCKLRCCYQASYSKKWRFDELGPIFPKTYPKNVIFAPFNEIFFCQAPLSALSPLCNTSKNCFGHNLRTVTLICARFEALESLFNFLSNNELISTKLMIYYYLILRFICWCVFPLLKIARLKPCLRHFIAHAPKATQYLQNE